MLFPFWRDHGAEKSLVTWATYKTKPAFRDEASNGRAKWTGAERMEVDEASDVTIPCIATQRNVKVSLSHRTFADEDLEDEFLQHVPINTLVLEQSNSTDERLKYRDRNKVQQLYFEKFVQSPIAKYCCVVHRVSIVAAAN